MDLTTTDLYWVAKLLYPILFISFYLLYLILFIALVYRDPTVPITQCNGLCHVTLSHN
jgi:hypothetical protein